MGKWTGIPYDERLGIASLAAVQAAKRHDPEQGRFSTLATTFIRNSYISEVRKHQTRMKYDGVQVSILTEDQIPADQNTPDIERAVIFKDALSKISEDAQTLANHALHPRKSMIDQGVTKKALQNFLGWNSARFNAAVSEIKSIF